MRIIAIWIGLVILYFCSVEMAFAGGVNCAKVCGENKACLASCCGVGGGCEANFQESFVTNITCRSTDDDIPLSIDIDTARRFMKVNLENWESYDLLETSGGHIFHLPLSGNAENCGQKRELAIGAFDSKQNSRGNFTTSPSGISCGGETLSVYVLCRR